jgi:DnaK suppressor protein
MVNKQIATAEQKLLRRRQQLHKQLDSLQKDDPFSDTDRLIDNAASDTEAKEEEGHDRVVALRAELKQELHHIDHALDRIKKGVYGLCEQCNTQIAEARLQLLPTATMCIHCEQRAEYKSHP